MPIHFKQGAINVVMVDDHKQKRKPLPNDSFYGDVLIQLRRGHMDYVFKAEQIEKIKSMLKPNEELIIMKEDFYYKLRLKKDE